MTTGSILLLFLLLLVLLLLLFALASVAGQQQQQRPPVVVYHHYQRNDRSDHRWQRHRQQWLRRRGGNEEGFIAFGADAELQSEVIVPLYSPAKPVLKVFDSLFFDASNGNLIEVIGPPAESTTVPEEEEEVVDDEEVVEEDKDEMVKKAPATTEAPPASMLPPPAIAPKAPLPAMTPPPASLPPAPLPAMTPPPASLPPATLPAAAPAMAPVTISASPASPTEESSKIGGSGNVSSFTSGSSSSSGKKRRRDDAGVTGIVVTTRANRSVAYDQPTGDNAVVACPESLINTVDASRAWFTYFSRGDEDASYAVFYAAWGSATYLHVIDRTTNAAVCSHRISPGDQHVLLYTNAAIVFGQANPNPQFQKGAAASSDAATTSVPGYPNAVYRLSSTGFLDPANGYLVLANPGAGQVAQYDRTGNNVVSSTVPTTISAVPADAFIGWSVVQAADLFVYLALGKETVVMQVQNSGTAARPRYTLVNVSCYLVGGTDAAPAAAAPAPAPAPAAAAPPPAPAAPAAAITPPDDMEAARRDASNKWYAQKIPAAAVPPAVAPPAAVPPGVAPPAVAPPAVAPPPAPAAVPASLSSEFDPLLLKRQPFSSTVAATKKKEIDDDAATKKKKEPQRVEGVDPRTAFGAMVRKPSNYKPTLASVVF